jgi:hypothetical protein
VRMAASLPTANPNSTALKMVPSKSITAFSV